MFLLPRSLRVSLRRVRSACAAVAALVLVAGILAVLVPPAPAVAAPGDVLVDVDFDGTPVNSNTLITNYVSDGIPFTADPAWQVNTTTANCNGFIVNADDSGAGWAGCFAAQQSRLVTMARHLGQFAANQGDATNPATNGVLATFTNTPGGAQEAGAMAQTASPVTVAAGRYYVLQGDYSSFNGIACALISLETRPVGSSTWTSRIANADPCVPATLPANAITGNVGGGNDRQARLFSNSFRPSAADSTFDFQGLQRSCHWRRQRWGD